MVKRRALTIALVSALVLCTWGGVFAFPSGADDALYHTVQYGETLTKLARRYGVSVADIVQVNSLANANVIYTGQRLLIPSVAESVVHTVVAGETLWSISAKYGVALWQIALRNGISTASLIFPGQKLVIPDVPAPAETAEPTAEITDTPEAAMPVVQEAILISEPAMNADVSSAVTVTGWGSGFENTLAVDILDSNGTAIGQGYVIVDAEFGQYGPFTGTVEFTTPASAQLGRIQVYSISPRDGAIEHLTSVVVNLRP